MTDRASLLPWTLANALGMALGFLTFIQTLKLHRLRIPRRSSAQASKNL